MLVSACTARWTCGVRCNQRHILCTGFVLVERCTLCTLRRHDLSATTALPQTSSASQHNTPELPSSQPHDPLLLFHFPFLLTTNHVEFNDHDSVPCCWSSSDRSPSSCSSSSFFSSHLCTHDANCCCTFPCTSNSVEACDRQDRGEGSSLPLI
jgi:hypothetical protein